MAAQLLTLLITGGILLFILKFVVIGGAGLVLFSNPVLWIFAFIIFAMIILSKRR